MREYLPILAALLVAGYVAVSMRGRVKTAGIKSRRHQGVAGTIGAILVVIVFLLGATVGRYELASWMYDTPVPSREQLRTARALIFMPMAAPLIIVFAWAWWHQRSSIRDAVRRKQYQPGFVDPSRESRLRIEEPGGGTNA